MLKEYLKFVFIDDDRHSVKVFPSLGRAKNHNRNVVTQRKQPFGLPTREPEKEVLDMTNKKNKINKQRSKIIDNDEWDRMTSNSMYEDCLYLNKEKDV